MGNNNPNVTRINLKTSCSDRKQLVDFCLNSEKQCLAIGWSYIYRADEHQGKICTYQEYYDAVKNSVKRMNHALNVFRDARKDDLFWTRDLDGCYWICRATDKAQPYYDESMDIGTVLPVEAYKVGVDVPGQIKASFNRAHGGIAQGFYEESIVEFSKFIFNQKSGRSVYTYRKTNENLLNNLPDFELEELVISYLQLKENYYVLSNSIANRSTTVKIECELISRDISNPRKAVVQVKGGSSKEIDARNYQAFADAGYFVYLFAPHILYQDRVNNVVEITREELLAFYKEYRPILPESITRWEDLFSVSAREEG
jgi:hypothetical protein